MGNRLSRVFRIRGLIFLLIPFFSYAQIPVRTWRTHFNYTDARGVAAVKGQVYCYSVNGFFRFDRVLKRSRSSGWAEGLRSGVISGIFYDQASDRLITAYTDGGIELISTDPEGRIAGVQLLSDLMLSDILTEKLVRGIAGSAGRVYLATSHAVLVVEPEEGYVKEMIRNVGPGGEDMEIGEIRADTDSLYLKSVSGAIRAASLRAGQNILFYGNWHASQNTAVFENKVTPPPGFESSYINDVWKETSGVYWIADGRLGLLSDISGRLESYSPPGLPEAAGTLESAGEDVLFVGSANYIFANDGWEPSGTMPQSPVKTDAYGNEWLITGRALQVRREGRSYLYSISNGLPGGVLSFAIDKNGQVWVGTDNGVAVIPSSSSAVTNPRTPFNPVYGTQRLLIREEVNAVAVDAGNRKWIGTANGLYLFDETGEDKIYYFDNQNSPMPDQRVRSVVAEERSGEIFIQTSTGVVSYRSDAVRSAEALNAILIFPNPVRAGSGDVVTIDGLEMNTEVKISDLGGTVVYSGISQGGRAVWDRRISGGSEAPPGIYLVVCRSGSTVKTGRFAIRP